MASDLSSTSLPQPAPAPADAPRAPLPERTPRSAPVRTLDRSFADELARGDGGDNVPAKAATRGEPSLPRGGRAAGDGEADPTAGKADARGADKARGQTTLARQNLTPLKRAAQTNRQDLDNAPVVAFLSGHLEKLQPAQIPELVTGNRFLSEALGEADLSTFLGKPMTVADLVKALDLPASLVKDAERLGLDASTKVTPADLLKALGLDPQRVFAELKVLKDNVALDGVASYVARASAMAPKDPTRRELGPQEAPEATALSKAAPVLPAGMLQPTIDPAKLTAVMPPAPGRVPMPATSTRGQAEPVGLAALTTGLQQISPAALLAGAPSLASQVEGDAGAAGPSTAARPLDMSRLLDAAGPKELDAGVADAASLAAQQAKDAAQAALTSQAPGQAADAAGQTVTAATQKAAATGEAATRGAAPPTMHKATFDAFALLGDKLMAADAQRVTLDPTAKDITKGTPNAGAGSLSEQLASRMLAGGSLPGAAGEPAMKVAVDAAKPLAPVLPLKPGADNGPSSVAAVGAATGQPTAADLRTPDRLGPMPTLETLPALREALTNAAKGPAPLAQAPKPAGPSGAVPLSELRLMPPVAAAASARQADDGGGQPGDDGGRGQQSGREAPRPVVAEKGTPSPFAVNHLGNHGGSGHGFAAQLESPVALSPAERVGMMQQVIERATVLAKSGGGTVRLDLGSAQLGHLEMAINMQGDRLDLRVLAGSDRVKDAVMADLGQLRSALSVQNVRLGSVEVGVGHRGAPSGGFASFSGNPQQQQQQQQQQMAQQAAWVEPRRPQVRPLPAAPRPVMPMAALAGAYAPAGRIAVRA